MTKLRTKIILGIVGCTISISLLVGIIVGIQSGKDVYKGAKSVMTEMAENNANKMNAKFTNIQSGIDNIGYNVSSSFNVSKTKDKKYIQSYINSMAPVVKKVGENIPNCYGIYLNFDPNLLKGIYDISLDMEDGNLVRSKTEYTLKDFKDSNEDLNWYYNPIKAKKGIWIDPYMDGESDIKMVSYVTPIYKDNILIGVVGIDIDFKEFKNTINQIKAYDTGYAFMLNKDLDYIVHKSLTSKDNLATIESGVYKSAADKISQNKSGYYDMKFNGENKIISYSKLDNGNILCISALESEAFKSMKRLKLIIGGILCIGTVICILVAMFIGNKISKPIMTTVDELDRISELDFTSSDKGLDIINQKDEIGHMARSVIKLKKELSTIIISLKQQSQSVNENSEGIVAATNESEEAIESVSEVVEELAKGATEQSHDAQIGTEKLEDLSSEIDKVVNVSEKVKEHSYNVQEINDETIESIKDLLESVKKSSDSSLKIGNSIQELANKSDLINNIINVIKAISEKTNLLALNAAIEAASAGEAGSGFAVVAEEIRKLANETAKSTEKVENIIKDIKLNIDKTSDDMKYAQLTVDKMEKAADKTKMGSHNIKKAVEESISKVDMLKEDVNIINKDKQDVVESIQSIAAISEESAASSEEVSASVEEQAGSIQLIAESCRNLKDVSEDLYKIVSKFNI